MRQYYSQHGEDYLIWSLFKRQTQPGFFVEVGCLDGIRFSNTYSFEQAGWTGLCIEPHPDFFPLLKQNRPASICVEVAAGNNEGVISFYAEPRGDFSTMMEENISNEKIARKMAGYKKVTVPVKSLSRILKETNAPRDIDFVSIDVEGAEMTVLESLDFSIHCPRVFVIEANDEQADKALDKFMKRKGYFKAGRLARTNNIYCRNLWDAIKLSVTALDCELWLSPHPFQALPGVDDQWRRRPLRQSGMVVETIKSMGNRIARRMGIR